MRRRGSALARDLGRSLGCGGLVTELRRTAIGPMEVGAAIAVEPDCAAERLAEALIPPEEIPLQTPVWRLEDDREARRFVLGNPLDTPEESDPDGFFGVFGPTGRLLGVAEKRRGQLRPRVVLAPPDEKRRS
jgi:tRNA pseudouridine55 synthase